MTIERFNSYPPCHDSGSSVEPDRLQLAAGRQHLADDVLHSE